MTTQVKDEVIHDSFTVQRRYRSGVQAVWRAFADPEVKRRWFAEGEGFEVLEYGLDFRVGGREHGSFKVLNAPVPLGVVSNETRYFDIREGRRIAAAYSMSNDGVPFSVSLVTVTFEPDGDGTLVTHHESATFFEGADGVGMRERGTRSLLESLAKELGEEAAQVAWRG
ncbi:MAG TPA: SRPBCC domain-containing protein [Trueperaceae bacterium]|jgi:uncharacterized protein YndB with AHSA1/START domain|nr:SRPBCC domain-containing protein [Trueperaceae bacterium]